MNDQLHRLIDLEAIHSLRSRYCRAIDTKDWGLLRSLFTADATFEGFGSAPDGSDVDAFVSGVSKRLANAISIHHCHMPEVIFLSDTHARGVWAMQDVLEWPEPIALKEAPMAKGFMGFGHYCEEYKKVDGIWSVNFLRLSRLRIDPIVQSCSTYSAGLRKFQSDWLVTSK